jgi:hypothetical protein
MAQALHWQADELSVAAQGGDSSAAADFAAKRIGEVHALKKRTQGASKFKRVSFEQTLRNSSPLRSARDSAVDMGGEREQRRKLRAPSSGTEGVG